MVVERSTTASRTTSRPAEYKRFKESQNSEFTGIGLPVAGDPRGLRVERSTTARRPSAPGSSAATSIVEADGHKLAGRQLGRGRRRPRSRARRHRREAHLASAAASASTQTLTRSTVSVPVVASHAGAGRRREGRRRRASRSSAPARTPRSTPALKREQKRGAKAFVLDLRGNGGGLVDEAQLVASAFLRRRHDRHDARAAPCRSGRCDATGDPVVPTAAARRARRQRHRVGVGDRHRRAAGPPPREGRRDADVRQGRLPGGHRALQRRRARHHRRPVLHAERAQPRRQAASQTGIWDPARRQGCRRPEDEEPRRGPGPRASPSWRARAAGSAGPRAPAARRAPRRARATATAPLDAARRPARAAGPLPRRRAVLRARAPRDGRARRATRGPGASRCCGRRAAAAGARRSCACSAAPTSRAT